jgi:hypothetical protein
VDVVLLVLMIPAQHVKGFVALTPVETNQQFRELPQ